MPGDSTSSTKSDMEKSLKPSSHFVHEVEKVHSTSTIISGPVDAKPRDQSRGWDGKPRYK